MNAADAQDLPPGIDMINQQEPYPRINYKKVIF